MFRSGEKVHLILSDEFESVVASQSEWTPNFELLKAIRKLRENDVKHLTCEIHEVFEEFQQASILCSELRATVKDPINVDWIDLQQLSTQTV